MSTTRLSIDIPTPLHQTLKTHAAINGLTMRDVVVWALELQLGVISPAKPLEGEQPLPFEGPE